MTSLGPCISILGCVPPVHSGKCAVRTNLTWAWPDLSSSLWCLDFVLTVEAFEGIGWSGWVQQPCDIGSCHADVLRNHEVYTSIMFNNKNLGIRYVTMEMLMLCCT